MLEAVENGLVPILDWFRPRPLGVFAESWLPALNNLSGTLDAARFMSMSAVAFQVSAVALVVEICFHVKAPRKHEYSG